MTVQLLPFLFMSKLPHPSAEAISLLGHTPVLPSLQVVVILLGKRHGSSIGHLLLVLFEHRLVDLDLWGSERRGGDELETLVTDELAGEPPMSTLVSQTRCWAQELQEGLFKVVVGLGRDVVILEVLLAVKCDGLGLDLTLLHIDLVTAKNDGNVFANANEIAWDWSEDSRAAKR